MVCVEHAGGPPLCVIEGFEYPTGHRDLAPGEWLCVVTDGVTEAMNAGRDLYGAQRLRAALARMAAASPQALVQELVGDVGRFAAGAEQSDDLTLLCVQWHGVAQAGLAPKEEEDFGEILDAPAA
jgi:serine phosphatase RsbU (regulator of sigma subunit)